MKTIARRRRHRLYGHMEIIERIEELLTERGMEQGELATAAGIRTGQFSKWKNQALKRNELRAKGVTPKGESGPSLRVGLKIAKALGIPPEALAFPDQPPPVEIILSEDERYLLRVFRDLQPYASAKMVVNAIADAVAAAKQKAVGTFIDTTPPKGKSKLPDRGNSS